MEPRQTLVWVRRGRGRWTDSAASNRWERHRSLTLWPLTASRVTLSRLLLPVLPRASDAEVQPTASESALQPEESRSAAQHSGSRRSDRLHRRSPRTLCSSRFLWHCVFTCDSAQQSQLITPLSLTASHPSTPVYSFTCSSTPPSSSSSSTTTTSPTSSLRGAAEWIEGEKHPGATRYPGDRSFLSTLGSVFASILWQQPATDGEEEAKEDGLTGLVTVEERWENQRAVSPGLCHTSHLHSHKEESKLAALIGQNCKVAQNSVGLVEFKISVVIGSLKFLGSTTDPKAAKQPLSSCNTAE